MSRSAIACSPGTGRRYDRWSGSKILEREVAPVRQLAWTMIWFSASATFRDRHATPQGSRRLRESPQHDREVAYAQPHPLTGDAARSSIDGMLVRRTFGPPAALPFRHSGAMVILLRADSIEVSR